MQWSAYGSFLLFAVVLVLLPGLRPSLDGAAGLAPLGFSARPAAEQG